MALVVGWAGGAGGRGCGLETAGYLPGTLPLFSRRVVAVVFRFRCVGAVLVTWRSSAELVRVVSEGGELERTGYSPGALWPLHWLLFAMASTRGVGRGQDAARAVVVVVVGRKKQCDTHLHAVSAFGRSRAAEPEGGIYLLKSPFWGKTVWLSWLERSSWFLGSWVQFLHMSKFIFY